MKTKFKIIGVVAAVALVVTGAYAATNAGSSSDPLVTLSYLTQVFTPDMEEDMEAMVSEKADEAMIQRQKEKYGWEFLFLGANIDAVETAGHLGIAPDRAVNYHCDSEGTRLNYEVVGQAVAAVRCSAPLDEHWKDAIEEDFRKRQKTGRR